MSVFARFAPRLQAAIVARLGWSSLRPVQEEAIRLCAEVGERLGWSVDELADRTVPTGHSMISAISS